MRADRLTPCSHRPRCDSVSGSSSGTGDWNSGWSAKGHRLPVSPVECHAQQRSATQEEHQRRAEHPTERAEQVDVTKNRPKHEINNPRPERPALVLGQAETDQCTARARPSRCWPRSSAPRRLDRRRSEHGEESKQPEQYEWQPIAARRFAAATRRASALGLASRASCDFL